MRAFLIWLLLGGAAAAQERFPAPDWQDRPNPLAASAALPGGSMTIYAGEYPKSFNYYLDQNVFAAELFGALYESLLTQNPLSLEYEPGLAAAWTIGADKKTFTFQLDQRARWSDGQPLTAADVAWTFAAVLRPENLTGPHKIALSRFEPPHVSNPTTICFKAKQVHWQNLDALASLTVLPKHVFEQSDFNKINFAFAVVSGPYRLADTQEGRWAILERRADWWNRAALRFRGVGNFQSLKFKFYAERENAFEDFKQGRLDLYPVYTAHLWATQTSGEKFTQNWIVRQKIYNHHPLGFQGFAMNLRRAPFDDRRVRQALAQALDRRRLNSALMHNQYFLQRSYFEDLYSAAEPCANQLLEYDLEGARAALAQAGWQVNPANGRLEKDGQPLRFRFLSHERSTDKFLVIYQEALKDLGIEMSLDQKDLAAWAKDMDEFNFDMTWAAWSAGVRKDPEPMWFSDEARRRSGQNLCGVSNAAIDELIISQRGCFDIGRRHAICRQIDHRLAELLPYILLWNTDYTRLLYWNKFGMPPTVLGKYGDERAAYWYWWADEDAAAELQDAMRERLPLPRRPDTVRFQEAFKPSSGR